MPLKTIPWDTADHLKTPADVVAYLGAALEEGADDPAFLVEAIGTLARARGAEPGCTRGLRDLLRIIASSEGVSGAAVGNGGTGGTDVRATFQYEGDAYEVTEPFGDSSRCTSLVSIRHPAHP